MINVVGASQDPDKATPATIYSFVSSPKKPIQPVEKKPDLATEQSASLFSQIGTKLQNFNQPKTAPQAPDISIQPEPETPVEPPVETVLPASNPELAKPISDMPAPKTPSTKLSPKLIWLGLVLIVLALGISATTYLGQSSQDIRQQASTEIQPEAVSLPEVTPSPIPELPPEPTVVTGKADQSGGLAGLVITQPALASANNLEAIQDSLPLAAAISPTITPAATPTPDPNRNEDLIDTRTDCNESCNVDENCSNPVQNCYQGVCRLKTNLTSSQCLLASGGNQINQDQADQTRIYSPVAELTGETPAAGPNEWLFYGLSGLGLLIFGGLALALL